MGNVYCVKSTIVTRHFLFQYSEESLWRLSIDRWGKKGGAGEGDTNVMGSLWGKREQYSQLDWYISTAAYGLLVEQHRDICTRDAEV
jgi:hypothetical protein